MRTELCRYDQLCLQSLFAELVGHVAHPSTGILGAEMADVQYILWWRHTERLSYGAQLSELIPEPPACNRKQSEDEMNV